MNSIRIVFLAVLSVIVTSFYGQVTITSTLFNQYNVSPEALCQVIVLNSSGTGNVVIEAQLRNSANELLMQVKTNPVQLATGVQTLTKDKFQVAQVNYGGNNQANFIKTQHRLSSGLFSYCVTIVPVSGIEDGDNYCEDIDAADDSFLYLVYPDDKEEIETSYPVLMWMHSESFGLLAAGEFFRITVAELKDKQDPKAGVLANSPVFVKSYLSQHDVQYPFDAPELIPGRRYGWHVQKISKGGVIIAQTEGWEFKVKETPLPKDHMYALLKKKLDDNFYRVSNDRIYFRFDEKYQGNNITCKVYSDRNKLVQPDLKKMDDSEVQSDVVKSSGYNQYEFDLQPYHLKKGFYVLQVTNEKGQVYQLRFYVE